MKVKELLKKVRQKGLKGCIKAIKYRSISLCNKFFFYYWQKKPLDENLIVMESGGEITDNAYALYDYLGKNGYLKKYHVVWLVYEISGPRKEHKIQHLYPNTKIVWGNRLGVHKEWDKYLALCKWHIYDHTNWIAQFKKREDQKIINLWHGCGFKGSKGSATSEKSPADINFVTGKAFYQVFRIVFNCDDNKLLDIGYPRNDYLLRVMNSNVRRFSSFLKLNSFNKVFLWMPTFRRSISKALDEDYFNSTTGLPIVDDKRKLDEFDKFLNSLNVICIFKMHHLQANLSVFRNNYKNIKIIKDGDLEKHGVQLYEIISLSDCLITDYSSVANDYMLLDRPIIYTLDDYEKYKKSRGFIPEDPINYFAGDHVKNIGDLKKSILNVSDGIDKYKNQRHDILPLIHSHVDGNSSQRIINYLGL